MAIVKAKYIRGKARIKAHLRYITHRRGMDGGRITRPLFGRDGALSKQQIYDMIDAASRGAVFHKFVINFHPVKEDTRKDLNLWEITRKTLEHIKTQFGDSVPFVATIHDDHTLFAISTAFSLLKADSAKRNLRKSRGCGRSPQRKRGASAPGLTACARACVSKNCSRLSKSTNANTSRGGEGGCETSGCSRPVNTAAMAVSGMPAYLLTCPVCKQWLTQSRQEHATPWKEAAPLMLTRLFKLSRM